MWYIQYTYLDSEFLALFVCFMSFSSHFGFRLFFATKLPKYYVFNSFFIFQFVFTCLALQTKNIVQKIMQSILRKTKNEVTKICD